jgi:cell division protein FtsI (penicillin-binding protein 3)
VKNEEIKLRIIILISIFSLAAICLLIQALWLQVVDIRTSRKITKVPLPCKRGFIYDRHGEALAITVKVPSLYASPELITNPHTTAKHLSKILNIKQKELVKRLKRQGEFIWIKRWLSLEEAKKVEELNINGLGFQLENKRYYPYGSLAGQVLGFVGLDGDGLEGIERKFDYFLKGQVGYYYGIKDARGYFILYPRLPIQPSRDGHNLYLTLDYKIQYAVEEALKKAVNKWQAKNGCVIVLVPQSGEILAMANYPSFNPNLFRGASPKIWRNRAISDTFEPGSTFKPILLSAALNEKILSPHKLLYAEKGLYRTKQAIFHDIKPFGWLSVEEVIIRSSNIGVVKIGEKVGAKSFYNYIKKFGFGKKTEIQLQGEASGLVHPVDQWKEIDRSTACFGQGLTVTALQLATAYGAIANGGALLKPILVKSIKDSKGKTTHTFNPTLKDTVVSSETSSLIRLILHKVVTEGTGQRAEISGYRVAGKTGTAQKVDPKTGKYQKDKHISSFVGFFPFEHPRVVIAVIINEPQPLSYGGVVAAPVFKEIANHLIWQWQLPPSSSTLIVQKERAIYPLPYLEDTKNTLSPLIVTDDVMPNLYGLPLRSAIKVLQGVNIKFKVEGMGKVVKQVPAPGSKIKEDMVCLLKLEVD